jgi:hypothetical protein
MVENLGSLDDIQKHRMTYDIRNAVEADFWFEPARDL